jgi:Zn-dependent protease
VQHADSRTVTPVIYDLGKRRSGIVRPSPLFLTVVAVAVLGGVLAWTGDLGARSGRFGVFLFILGGWVVSVCFHEFAHAFMAYRAGDRSVEGRGYLTLNPFKYAHPVLSILLPLVFIIQGGIGLPGGAVYLHRHAFRSKASQSVAAAAGPVTNLIFAVILLRIAKSHLELTTIATEPHLQFWSAVAFLGFLQVTAAVLNLLPIPGLDGYAIIEPYLDPQTQQFGDKIKPWGLIGVIVLLQINSLNDAFFRLVNNVYDVFGTERLGWVIGHDLFKFWTKNPF